MLPNDILTHYGTWTKAMRAAELGNNSYRKWLTENCMPYTAQLLFEKITNGKLQSDKEHTIKQESHQ
jgi:hypothetical protein